MPFRLLLAIAALCVTASSHAQTHQAGDLTIDRPFARATVSGQASAAAYITVENKGRSGDRLVSASTPAAKSVELHTMSRDGDIMRMREVKDIPVAAGTSVAMKPGDGYHLMLMGLKSPIKTGDKFPMTLTFEKAGKVDISVSVEDRGASSSTSGHHGQHGAHGNKTKTGGHHH